MFRQKQAVCIVAVVALVLGILGCETVSDDPTSTATRPSASSIAVTDPEALQMMSDAYAAYVVLSDHIYSDGGSDAERIDEVARGTAAEEFKNAASELRARQFRTVGSTSVDSIRIQKVEASAGGYVSITAYLCSDVSAVDVVDAAGISKISPDRNARTPYEVVVGVESSGAFVVSRTVWVGDNFC